MTFDWSYLPLHFNTFLELQSFDWSSFLYNSTCTNKLFVMQHVKIEDTVTLQRQPNSRVIVLSDKKNFRMYECCQG
jgi:hypothetical protein